MNKYTIILILAVLVLSCRNTKEIVKSNTEVKTATETDISKSQSTNTDKKVISVVSEKTTEDEFIVTEETITELSKPDSTGKQHPIKVTKRTTTSGKNKEIKVDENTEINQATDDKKTETVKQTEDKVINNETDVKIVKKSQSWKIVSGIIVFLILAGFVVYKWKGTAIKTAFKGLLK